MKRVIICLMSAAVGLLPYFAEGQTRPKHVVLVGADGMSSRVVRENPGAFSNIEALMARGSATLERRSVLPSSSAVNWASMLMGAGPELHGYTTWGSKTPELPSRVVGQYDIFPGIAGLIREGYPDAKIGFGYVWSTIGCLYEQGASDLNYNASSERILTDSMCLWVTANKPLFAFMSFDEPDVTGHAHGWESPEYLAMCKTVDGYLGEVIAAIEKAGMTDSTVVIFTSDHGGIEKGHGGKTMAEMEAPFVIAGPGIKKGYYIGDSVMIYDTASTIAYLLGLHQPQVWIGRPILSVFE